MGKFYLLNWEVKWHIYASVCYAIIGSDNGFSLAWYQAIIWANAGSSFIGNLKINFSKIEIKKRQSMMQNINLENVI